MKELELNLNTKEGTTPAILAGLNSPVLDREQNATEASLEVLEDCKLEASLASAQPADRFQFLRLGYFCADSRDSQPGHLVFNRAVSLKDSFKPQ